MNTKIAVFLILVLSLSIVLAGCRLIKPGGESPAEESSVISPVQVTEQFYTWYMNYGVGGKGETGSPLYDGAYRTSPYLSAGCVAEIDAALANPGQGGVDPFLQAQGFPQSYSFEEDFTAGDVACVIFRQQTGPETSHDLTIDLIKEGNSWKIHKIRAGNPHTPQGTTQLFYEWYIDYAHNQANPLVDGIYKTSPYLNPVFITLVSETVSGFESGGYDPILLAQDIPDSISVQPAVVNGSRASVVVERYWSGSPTPSPITVHLEANGGYWLIVNVSAAESAPEMVDPAAVFCRQHGYTYEIRAYADGSRKGFCILPNGLECDGFAFLNGVCPPASSAAP